MKYQIKQIILTDAQIDQVNANPNVMPDFYKRYMGTTFAPTVENVAVIEATCLDEVFAIGNGMGDQTAITRLKRMKSVSVGDIIVAMDDVGEEYFVDTFGFVKL
jgi:hypothetical protein